MHKILTIITLALLSSLPSAANGSLQSRLDSILQGRRMTVGVYADCGGATYGLHEDVSRVYRNWSTPRAMTRLLRTIRETMPCDAPLLASMRKTSTGKDKMPAAMTDSLTLYHKTGSSDRTDGIKTADNDCGIIHLPDGRLLYLTIFIKESAESDETNAEVIAEITRAVIAEVTARSNKTEMQ